LAKPVTTDDGTVTEAVREIDWTADSAASAIRPGEFDEFEILAGPLPDTASVTFKAIQTYSDGTIVSWIETPAPGSTTEPDHPAPVLSLSAAHATAATPAVVNKSSTAAPTALSIVALALAAAALGMVVVQRAKGRAAP
jgi:uncharacterized protein